MKEPKYFKQPNDYSYNHNNVEDFFDFPIHGNVPVDKPKKNTYNNQYNYNIKQWHNNEFRYANKGNCFLVCTTQF